MAYNLAVIIIYFCNLFCFHSLNRGSRTYFYVSVFAYIAGLSTAIFVGDKYGNPQPALLYLAPACMGAPLFLALIKGDFSEMLE